MPASLLASMMPWRQVLRSCAEAPPAILANIANVADNRTTFEHLQRAMRILLWLAPPVLAGAHLTTARRPAQSPILARSGLAHLPLVVVAGLSGRPAVPALCLKIGGRRDKPGDDAVIRSDQNFALKSPVRPAPTPVFIRLRLDYSCSLPILLTQ